MREGSNHPPEFQRITIGTQTRGYRLIRFVNQAKGDSVHMQLYYFILCTSVCLGNLPELSAKFIETEWIVGRWVAQPNGRLPEATGLSEMVELIEFIEVTELIEVIGLCEQCHVMWTG
jgi:hypothetical protein